MPTKESLDRAREWYGESGLVPDEHQVVHDAHFACSESEPFEQCANRLRDEMAENEINSLALEFDRVRLEEREKESFQCMALFRGARTANDVYLLIHDRARDHKAQLAALTQPAGEKEGRDDPR